MKRMKRRSFLRQATFAGAALSSMNGLLAQEAETGVRNHHAWNSERSDENPVRVAVVQH